MATQTATKAPRNKRLSQYDRERLTGLARKVITASEPTDVMDGAYHNLAAVIRSIVERDWPVRDMRVLLKYSAAEPDQCLFVSRGYGDRDEFCFRDGDKIPLRPNSYNCKRETLLLDEPTILLLDTFTDAKKAYKKSIADRLTDYEALISSAASFNEVAGVWPEAEDLRDAIVGTGTALVVMNNEIVERIRADTASRMAEAA